MLVMLLKNKTELFKTKYFTLNQVIVFIIQLLKSFILYTANVKLVAEGQYRFFFPKVVGKLHLLEISKMKAKIRLCQDRF